MVINQTQPISQMDEEERRKLEQAKALSRSQAREQTTAYRARAVLR